MVAGKEAEKIPDATGHDLVNRTRHSCGQLLFEPAAFKMGASPDFTPVGSLATGNHPHQGRFAATVAAHQADPLAGVKFEIHSLQERLTAETQMDIFQAYLSGLTGSIQAPSGPGNENPGDPGTGGALPEITT